MKLHTMLFRIRADFLKITNRFMELTKLFEDVQTAFDG